MKSAGILSRITVPRLILLFVFSGLFLVPGIVTGAGVQDAGTAVHQQRISDDVALQQAYMSWLAAQQEAEMNATIRYIVAINGSEGSLPAISGDFHAMALRIPSCDTADALDASLVALMDLTRGFNAETRARIEAATGTSADSAAVKETAVEYDTRARLLEDEYWMSRMVAGPSSIDRYIRESQATLAALQEYGYDVASAQEKLDTITAMRREFFTALGSHDYGTAESISEKIQDASLEFEKSVVTLRVSEPGADTGSPAAGVPEA